MKLKKLDEYELIMRGDIFKRTLLFVGICLLLYTFLFDMDIIFLHVVHANLLIIMAAVTFFSVSMIHKNIYPLSENRQRFVIFSAGVCGLIAVVLSTISASDSKESLIVSGYMSEDLVIMILGGLLILIPVYYVIHKIKDKEV